MENYLFDIFKIFNDAFTGKLPKDPLERGILGQGLYLVPLKIKDNKLDYSYLYKDGKKISKYIFRIGGMCNGFKKGNYCNLIQYDNIKTSFGNHCIIDTNGKIMLMCENILDYPYYLRGVIASTKDVYYNLLTQQPIVKGSHSINSEKYLFVENNYNKEYKKGVYKIDYETGNFEIFE